LLAAYKENEDIIQIGAYTVGSNRRVDNAIRIYEQMMKFLRQGRDETASIQQGIENMNAIKNILRE